MASISCVTCDTSKCMACWDCCHAYPCCSVHSTACIAPWNTHEALLVALHTGLPPHLVRAKLVTSHPVIPQLLTPSCSHIAKCLLTACKRICCCFALCSFCSSCTTCTIRAGCASRALCACCASRALCTSCASRALRAC